MSTPGKDASSESERWRRIRALFELALEVPTEDAARLVREHSGDDQTLAHEVLELLDRHARDDGFLATPLLVPPANPEGVHGSWTGRRLGPYRILREIAVGGMGVVYEAEQEAPQRRVALKVLRSSLPGSDALRRFREEAEMLARLRHPGIAQVFAAGAAVPDGAGAELPYIALELVDSALPLLAFADERASDWRQRVELLLQVCEAVQHGHQRGVIHRDLKPQNVLVDADGRCKVVDFGIARLVDRDASQMRTIPGMVLGTPAYMSPEQLEGDPDAIDVRTDVYALGVILFELLTGTQPFDISGKPLTEALHALRTAGAPPRPCARRPSLPREIDWIFHKAVERDVARRYGSVSELATDLRRLLDDEPVLVGPPSTAYRLRKLARRHRVALTAAGFVLLAIVAALIVSLVSRGQAIRERDRARQEQLVAGSVLRFVQDTFSAADPDRAGRDVRVRDLLRDAARELDAALAMDPLVKASLDFTIGSTFAGIGMDDEALLRLRAARDAFVTNVGPVDRRAIEAESALATALRVVGRMDEALAVARRAVEHTSSLPVGDDARIGAAVALAQVEHETGEYEPAVARLLGATEELVASGRQATAAGATVYSTLGQIQMTRGEFVAARAHLDRAVDLAYEVHGPGHPRTTEIRHARALLLEELGERAEAEQELRDIVGRSEEALGQEHRATLSAKSNLGALLRRMDRRAEAGELLEELLVAYSQQFGPDDRRTLAVQHSLALLRRDEQQFEAAEALLRDSLARARRVLDPGDMRLPSTMQDLASVLRRRGDHGGAAALLEEALGLIERELGADNPRTLQARFNLGVVARSMRDLPRAEALVSGAFEGRRRVLGPDHPDTLNAMHELARIERYAGRLTDAETTARELLERRRAHAEADDNDDWIIAALLLAQILEARGSMDEAGPLYDEIVDATAATESERTLRAVNARNVAADFWVQRGETEKARALLLRNVAAFETDADLGAETRDSLERRTRALLEKIERPR